MFIHFLAYDYNKNGINLCEFANRKILENAINNEYRLSIWRSSYNNFVREVIV